MGSGLKVFNQVRLSRTKARRHLSAASCLIPLDYQPAKHCISVVQSTYCDTPTHSLKAVVVLNAFSSYLLLRCQEIIIHCMFMS